MAVAPLFLRRNALRLLRPKVLGSNNLALKSGMAIRLLNAAGRLDHISPFKSVGLHPLKGNRRGQWAITVNGPWRICFRFKGGDAHDVEIVDYH
jgi:plasmid maintenance system killer protein